MNSKKRYQIVIPDLSINQDVYPINDKDISYSWERQDDIIFYDKKLKNRLVFANRARTNVDNVFSDDFNFFYNIESNPISRCYTIYLNIYKKCDGVDVLEFEGVFSMNDCEWDLDKCRLSVKPSPNSTYECLKKNKNKEINILNLPTAITTKANLDYNYEFYVCNSFGGACSLPGPNTSTWDLFYQNNSQAYTSECAPGSYYLKVYYREFVVTACVGGSPAPPPGTGWFLEINNCGTSGTAKYVRAASAGPLPSIGTTSTAPGWYNTVTNTDEMPPMPSFFTQTIQNNPQSEDLFIDMPHVYFMNDAGVQIDYYVEVLNNPNSTYAWTLDGTSAVSATITSMGNVCKITPNNNATGIIKLLLTETHGNAYVSTKNYNITQGVVGTSEIVKTISFASFTIKGPSYACKNQTKLIFIAPQTPTVSGGIVTTGPTWSVTGGASITAGQGTNIVEVTAGTSNFNVSYNYTMSYTSGLNTSTITMTKTLSVNVGVLPVTMPIYGLKYAYPNEPQTMYVYRNYFATSYDWYRSTTALSSIIFGTISAITFNANASVGTECFYVKEHVACGCNWIKLESAQYTPSGLPWPKFPPVYWCYNSSATAISYTRGRSFKEACEYVLQQINCGFSQIHSDFFEWNVVADAPGYSPGINYVTGATNKLNYLTIHQKSDVLNPTSSNPATKGMLTFEKMTKIWRELFNCFWFIDSSGRFRVEHLKYFNNTMAYDSTISPHAKFNIGKRVYTYNKEQMPKYERFGFSEVLYADFIGADIYYDSICVNQDPDGNVAERGTKDFLTTDLYALFIDPASANKVGFVLMCNDFDGSNYVVSVDTGVISNSLIANVHLSWANLHDAYHRYGRILLVGYMNNVLTTFVTAKKNKLQKDIVLQLCCDDEFNPTMSYIPTELGNGIIESAEHNSSTGILKTNLLH